MALRLEYLPADVLGLSETARTALAGRPSPWGPEGARVPSDAAGTPRAEDRLELDERVTLARGLEDQLAFFEPHVAVLDATRALAQPGARLVVAGQQPGFLGGPLYNTYKVLHAVRLARELSSAWQVPVLPAFWNHADDHDIAEVHHLWLPNENLDLRKVAIPGASSGRAPLSRFVFAEEQHRLGALRELLSQALAPGRHVDEALELFMPRHGESLSRAFTRALLELFGHLGLVVIEPDWIRERLSRSLAELVAGPLQASLQVDAGSSSSVQQDAALVFRLIDGERHALRLTPAGEYAYDNEPGSRTGTELAAEIIEHPEEFSAGALLRPLAQDVALPVAAYVGGWGELAYLSRLPPVRRAFEIPNTPFVPRLSATLLDAQERRSLEKLGLSVREALTDPSRLETESAEGESSPVGGKLRDLGERSAQELEALRDELAGLDPGLGGQVRRAASQWKSIADKLAGKADRVQANRDGKGRRHARRLQAALHPRGLPQERVRGTIEVVARHGRGWIDELLGELDPFPTEHLVAAFESDSEERP